MPIAVACRLHRLVPGDRSSQRWRQIAESRPKRFVQRVAVALRQMQQENEAGLALDEGADCGLLVRADDQVAFPMSSLVAIFGWEWPLVDRQHRLLESWASPILSAVRAAVITAGPQRRTMLRREP